MAGQCQVGALRLEPRVQQSSLDQGRDPSVRVASIKVTIIYRLIYRVINIPSASDLEG